MTHPILPATYIGGEIVNLVLQSGLVAKAVLLILFLFSLLSWAIILAKWGSYGRATAQSGRFVRAFRKAVRLQDFSAVSDQFKPSPLVAVFEGGYEEFRKQLTGTGELRVQAIQRSMQVAASEEQSRLERRLQWLATIANVAPFIGLFGTVWGIIDAFHGLGTAGAATLRAVAPGISEALITTAAGLFSAIPAVIFYNHFTHDIREFSARMDEFQLEMLNAVERSANVPELTR